MPTGIYDRTNKLSDAERKARASDRMRKQYATKEKVREDQRNNKLLKAYGITAAQYNEFSTFCEHKCAICDNACPSGRRLAVDHDHSNGVIRGLLCINCNKGIGNFKDNIELLESAISYLINYKEALEEQNAINALKIKGSISKEFENGIING